MLQTNLEEANPEEENPEQANLDANFIEFYKDVHYHPTKGWVTQHAEQNYVISYMLFS